MLEAITRFIDVPEVTNPRLILIVGCMGLASNIIGFFVLGGHGHSHGPEGGHSHGHGGDEISAAEEGHSHSHSHDGHGHSHAEEEHEEAISPVKVKGKQGQHLRFDSQDSTVKDGSPSHARTGSKGSKKHRRRASSIRNQRYSTLEEISIHPTSFRQNIIAASRSPVDGSESEENATSDDETAINGDGPTENSPLLQKLKGNGTDSHDHAHDNHDHDHDHDHDGHAHSHPPPLKQASWHASHNHNKPRKASKGGHGHSHGDMGMNGMILHVIGDALGNVGVIVSALIIWLTTWSGRFYADPAVSLFITLIILKSCIPLTSATAKILLQATPDHIDVQDIKEDIQDIPGVISCHHVHIWQLSDTQMVASMHIQVSFPISEASGERYMELALAARGCLHAYGIHSATIQPEFCTDKDHNHNTGALISLDGNAGSERCRLNNETCLLGCVEDCEAQKCCDTSTMASESDHEGHSH